MLGKILWLQHSLVLVAKAADGRGDFTFVEGGAAAVDDATRHVILCNPNNPTGTSVGAEAFDRFMAAMPEDLVVAIDEAYYEYVRRPDFPDALAWVARRPNTVVLRTFSKIYGLAGLRIGYGVMGRELAGMLERARHPFNVNLVAERAALAALGDAEHVEQSRAVNARGSVASGCRPPSRRNGGRGCGREGWAPDSRSKVDSFWGDYGKAVVVEGDCEPNMMQTLGVWAFACGVCV